MISGIDPLVDLCNVWLGWVAGEARSYHAHGIYAVLNVVWLLFGVSFGCVLCSLSTQHCFRIITGRGFSFKRGNSRHNLVLN